MPYTERLRCSFDIKPDGEGRPSRIYADLHSDQHSLLGHKQIGRLFFALKNGTEWTEAEDLAKQMSQMLGSLCINHLADGESG
jgi:hypothetical protein